MSSSAPDTAVQKPKVSLSRPLGIRNFRLLWIGETTSLLGDQSYAVALPWLILQLTSSGKSLGLVMMAAAIPRAVFMLAGGVIVDHLNSRAVMIASNLLRMTAVSILAVLVMTHRVQMWHVLALAICFGFAEAFFFPAYTSIVPSLVQMDLLPAANALLTISFQIALIAGPAIAGIVIGKLGIAPTLWADAATFVVSLSMLLLLRPAAVAKKAGMSMRGSLAEGGRYVWHDPVIRGLIFGFSAINFSTFGPFFVGAPILAKTHFGTATALGAMFAFYGVGALVGGGIAGSVKRTPNVGPLLLTIAIAASAAMFGMGLIPRLWLICAVMFTSGAVVGFGRVFVMAFLQTRAEPRMMGRVMSFVMLGSLGTMPVSFALTGILAQRNTAMMFAIAGTSCLVLGSAASMNRVLWRHVQKAAMDSGATTGTAA